MNVLLQLVILSNWQSNEPNDHPGVGEGMKIVPTYMEAVVSGMTCHVIQ